MNGVRLEICAIAHIFMISLVCVLLYCFRFSCAFSLYKARREEDDERSDDEDASTRHKVPTMSFRNAVIALTSGYFRWAIASTASQNISYVMKRPFLEL